jgi:apolipoprotein N-acyltransferase
MAWATAGSLFSRWGSLRWTALGIILLTTLNHWPTADATPPSSKSKVRVAGIQLEFPTADEVLTALNQAVARHPETELFVLSEYTFQSPVPDSIRAWCREHRKYLIVGGKAPLEGDDFYNTTFVVGPDGDTVFQQAKSVPIQFFADGQPAPERRLWSSPWGRIGFAICYDLSYRRVVDDVVRQGAQALIVPAMDVADWGAYEHDLHARVARVRAAEYGLPIFRVASSGISQHVDPEGRVLGATSFPGQGEVLSATLWMEDQGRIPWDAHLSPLATAGTILCGLMLLIPRRRRPPGPGTPPHECHTNPRAWGRPK